MMTENVDGTEAGKPMTKGRAYLLFFGAFAAILFVAYWARTVVPLAVGAIATTEENTRGWAYLLTSSTMLLIYVTSVTTRRWFRRAPTSFKPESAVETRPTNVNKYWDASRSRRDVSKRGVLLCIIAAVAWAWSSSSFFGKDRSGSDSSYLEEVPAAELLSKVSGLEWGQAIDDGMLSAGMTVFALGLCCFLVGGPMANDVWPGRAAPINPEDDRGSIGIRLFAWAVYIVVPPLWLLLVYLNFA